MSLEKITHCFGYNAGAFWHSLYRFSDDSVLTTCEIGDAEYIIQGVRMYQGTAPGAAVGYCQVGNDWDGTLTGGYWDFTLTGPDTSVATYRDQSSSMDGQSRTMACDDV